MSINQIAEYGIAMFAIAALAWVLVSVLGKKRTDPDLVKVISDNTKAMTELATLIREQSELLRQQSEVITNLRIEAARKAG